MIHLIQLCHQHQAGRTVRREEGRPGERHPTQERPQLVAPLRLGEDHGDETRLRTVSLATLCLTRHVDPQLEHHLLTTVISGELFHSVDGILQILKCPRLQVFVLNSVNRGFIVFHTAQFGISEQRSADHKFPALHLLDIGVNGLQGLVEQRSLVIVVATVEPQNQVPILVGRHQGPHNCHLKVL